ncbi:hypothetical protein BDR05DRAFT_949327 [Suillus weaverae]|nr:hypothetical protein BDR05DRAFT_949327 [Suillus weaverae]
MSSFAPGHFGEYPPPLGEGPRHPERPQDPGQTNLVIGEMLQVSINNSMPDPLDDTPRALGEEPSQPEQLQDPGETQITEMQQVVITARVEAFQAIRATDLTLGLRRIPAGFHVVLKTECAEFQTSNKPVHVDQAVVEWNELILLPCELSSIVRVGVYASFELGPMLCHGEVLRTFEISVGELLDRSEMSDPIIFQPKQEEVVSSCTSLVVRVERRSDENGAAVLCPLTAFMSDDIRALLLRTDAGHGLLARYRRMQNHRDLDQSINHFEHALDICPMDHPCRPAALFNLATAKFVNCQANGTHADLDIPISLFQDALDLRPIGHLDRPVTQLHLAISLLSRFVKRGFQTDADTAEELLSEILDVCRANSHIYKAALLAIETSALHPAGSIDANDLGQERPAASMLPLSPDQLAHLVEWCSRIDDPHALDEVISLHYDALGYYNTGHTSRGGLLGNLSVLLHTRFQRRGNDEDLDQAITLQSEALALHPVGRTQRSTSFLNLAVQLSTRFNHRGHVEDLDEAVALGREALALCHTDRSLSLNNLAGQLYTRFRHQGNDQDLAEAIALQREALALCPVGHTYRPMSLYNLANQLSVRFNHRGHAEDLDEALVLQREGLALCPVGHTGRSKSLDSLGNRLSIHFDHRGNAEDLDEAIALHREALALRPVGNTDRSTSLNNLANRLSTRFHDRGHAEDLDEAIALHREALALRPVGHADRSESFDNLANQLSARFVNRGNAEDLDEAMALQREALALCPVGHTDRSKSLNNLANRLFIRFHDRGYAEDLDEAIALRREVLALRPIGHTDRSKSLNNLALSLSTRFQHQGNREDLDESRENLCCALTLLMQHDPFQLTVHDSLATVYLLFHQSGLHTFGPGEDTDSLNAVMHHLKAAANVVSGSLLHRLETSLLWVRHASQYSHGTELEAYATSMQLLDAYMSATVSVSSRHDTMKAFPSTLAVDAASCALRSDDVCRAVELLEQGRTVIWTQMTRLRTPLDSLQTRGDHVMALVKRFRDISSLLDKGPAIHAKGTPRMNVEAEEARYRRLVEDWNKVVEEIRKIEDFSRFLLPPLFSDLQDAARDGPIIVLIASKSSCDAIIIPHKQPPTSIPLPTSLEKLQILVDKLQRTGNPALIKTLVELWDDVVCPVVKNLGKFAQRATCALRDNNWFHFACHGTQNLDEPFNSAFLMRDQPLSLLDITQMDLSRHQFAFLSACETAVGDSKTPDEVIHLAAGLQFAGVENVVGTLWEVEDSTVRRLVEAFYKNLCGDGTMNSKRAARALHRAVQSLACDKDIPLDQRIVFMHIGI